MPIYGAVAGESCANRVQQIPTPSQFGDTTPCSHVRLCVSRQANLAKTGSTAGLKIAPIIMLVREFRACMENTTHGCVEMRGNCSRICGDLFLASRGVDLSRWGNSFTLGEWKVVKIFYFFFSKRTIVCLMGEDFVMSPTRDCYIRIELIMSVRGGFLEDEIIGSIVRGESNEGHWKEKLDGRI